MRPNAVVQGFNQPTLENLQGWRLSNFGGQPVPMLVWLLRREHFLYIWSEPLLFAFILLSSPCATMKSPNLPSWWLHHRYWRALSGPPKSAFIRLSKPCFLRIQLPAISLASAELALVYWCTQLYSLTWQISALTSCPCVVLVHLSKCFFLLKNCSDTQCFLEYVCLQSGAWKQMVN